VVEQVDKIIPEVPKRRRMMKFADVVKNMMNPEATETEGMRLWRDKMPSADAFLRKVNKWAYIEFIEVANSD
jgi:hypothetical protein